MTTASTAADADEWFAHRVLEPTDRCGRHEPLPGWSWRPRLGDHDLWLVRAGRGVARLEGREPVPLAPGTLLLLRPGDRGEIRQDEDAPVAVTFAHFRVLRDGAPEPIPERLSPGPAHRIEPAGPTASALEALVRSRQGGRPMARLRARAHLAQALAGLYALPDRARGGHEETARRAAAVLAGAPGRRHTLAEVAESVGIRPRALAPLFREHLGMGFREYQLETRLLRAQALVGETDLPVTAIARLLGYADHTLFTKQFRARFGRSPREYRRG